MYKAHVSTFATGVPGMLPLQTEPFAILGVAGTEPAAESLGVGGTDPTGVPYAYKTQVDWSPQLQCLAIQRLR